MKEGTGRLAATFRAYFEKIPFLKIVSQPDKLRAAWASANSFNKNRA